MGGSFFMRLYTKEYLSDSKVRTLAREHRADLVDLWCHCDQEGSLPIDATAIGRLLGISSSMARKTLDALRPFFVEEDGRLYSPRQRKERLAREAELSGKREGARKTNGKRWGKESLSESLSDTESEDCDGRSATSERLAKRIASGSPVSNQYSVSNSPSLRSGEDCSEAGKPPAEPPSDPALLSLPCVGRGPREWPVTQHQLDEWAEAYPGIAILAEVRRMRLWLEENATRRKTFRGMGPFVLRWLGRAQNHAPALTSRTAHAAAGGSRAPAADDALKRQIEGKQWPTLPSRVAGGS